jgi:hypothetical protein
MTEFASDRSPVSTLDDFRESLLDDLRELAAQFEDDFEGMEYTLLFPPQELADEDSTLTAIKLTDDESVRLVFNGEVELDAESLAADDLAGLMEALSELTEDEDDEETMDERE